MQKTLLIFPHQLFSTSYYDPSISFVVLLEDPLFFKDEKYPAYFHKQKLVLHRASMKNYQQELIEAGFHTLYIEAADLRHGEISYEKLFKKLKLSFIEVFDPVDYLIEKRLRKACKNCQIELKLLEAGHHVIALVRHPNSLQTPFHKNLTVIFADLLSEETLHQIPQDIDVAYYLVHAMSYSRKDFPALEETAATHFLSRLKKTNVKQIIYLSGLSNDLHLSSHLNSRYKTECLIKSSGIPYTILRAGIIIGSGSASFEIIRDLVD